MSKASEFERLVAEHETDVLRVTRSVLREEQLGRDAAQDTFLRLLSALRRGERAERWGAWLRRAALDAALDLRRRRAARPLELAEVDRHPDMADPSAAARAGELHERFERAVEALPDGQRTIFLLRHDGDTPLSEIAQLLELSPSTVKTQFARAALRVQAALRAFDPHGEESR